MMTLSDERRWRIPRPSLWLRWNALACGAAIFIWSTPEDDRVWVVSLLALWLTLSLLVGWVVPRYAGQTLPDGVRGGLLVGAFGALTGVLTPMLTVVLMIFKDARHAHPLPDFPPELLLAMPQRVPVWALAGALFAFAFWLWATARR